VAVRSHIHSSNGKDGKFSFWDKDHKVILKNSREHENSISIAKFSPNGEYLAYAVSYDWSQGFECERKLINSLEIEIVQDQDMTPKFLQK
jgi:mRNA export factor